MAKESDSASSIYVAIEARGLRCPHPHSWLPFLPYLCNRGAALNSSDCFLNLGTLLAHGIGTERNLTDGGWGRQGGSSLYPARVFLPKSNMFLPLNHSISAL